MQLIVCQLPEFGVSAFEAGNSGWSALRDAQHRFSLDDPASGLVVVLGAGDPWDIHPPNKQKPARRAVPVWAAAITDAPSRTSLVRYCWGDTPICNLMPPDGVPVTPFELKLP